MNAPRIYVDFQNADTHGRVRLNCIGTLQDLAGKQIHLRDGLPLTLYSDDADRDGRDCELQTEGVVQFSADEQIWVATIDWQDLHQVACDAPAKRHYS